eukprot:276145-Rhodomonas_salina.1
MDSRIPGTRGTWVLGTGYCRAEDSLHLYLDTFRIIVIVCYSGTSASSGTRIPYKGNPSTPSTPTKSYHSY